MNNKKSVYNILFLFFSSSLFAENLSEAFIEIQTNERYDSFFRVLVDNETPYVNISTLLPLLYGLEEKCNNDRCHYFVALKPADNQTTIDFNKLHCYTTSNKKRHQITVQHEEEQYWLHWQDIGTCFNASVYWDPDSYILKIQTRHLSPTDMQESIDLARSISIKKAQMLNSQNAQPRTRPTNTTIIQNRLSLTTQYTAQQFRVEVANDFFFVTTNNFSMYQCNQIALTSLVITAISMKTFLQIAV
ncbi:hypothetical protein AYY19_11910 [Photobacterium aquimaris]|uniref:hypothetical protein n=1 Tax=Photobacterium aquimaris TaxID=512643 RepID=UPI0007EF355E|nr:hypothetical protein [Photobacterium aquimaris]OBU17843.1 hypothetical protein AYY19_11910 [Photobacterium aquimaris]PSW02442.1 hypothetical protein CTM91_05050 [Photobacterium aquimaris]